MTKIFEPNIFESDIFWLVKESEQDVKKIFDGLDPSYISSLDIAYKYFCSSIHIQEHFLKYRNKDLSLFSIFEGYRSYGDKPVGTEPYEIKASNAYKKFVKQEDLTASRDFEKLRNDFRKFIENIIFSIPKGMAQSLKEKIANEFAKVYREAWLLGRKASGLFYNTRVKPVTAKEEDWFATTVQVELGFFNKFLAVLSANKLTHYSAQERSEMYVKALQAMFNQGKMSGLPSNVLLFWYPQEKVNGEMCPGCAYMVGHSPFTFDTMPTVPRGGDTPCLLRCVHRVVVRYTTEEKVKERKKQLPKKEKMLEDLESFMHYHPIRIQKNSVLQNPWLKRKFKKLR